MYCERVTPRSNHELRSIHNTAEAVLSILHEEYDSSRLRIAEQARSAAPHLRRAPCRGITSHLCPQLPACRPTSASHRHPAAVGPAVRSAVPCTQRKMHCLGWGDAKARGPNSPRWNDRGVTSLRPTEQALLERTLERRATCLPQGVALLTAAQHWRARHGGLHALDMITGWALMRRLCQDTSEIASVCSSSTRQAQRHCIRALLRTGSIGAAGGRLRCFAGKFFFGAQPNSAAMPFARPSSRRRAWLAAIRASRNRRYSFPLLAEGTAGVGSTATLPPSLAAASCGAAASAGVGTHVEGCLTAGSVASAHGEVAVGSAGASSDGPQLVRGCPGTELPWSRSTPRTELVPGPL